MGSGYGAAIADGACGQFKRWRGSGASGGLSMDWVMWWTGGEDATRLRMVLQPRRRAPGTRLRVGGEVDERRRRHGATRLGSEALGGVAIDQPAARLLRQRDAEEALATAVGTVGRPGRVDRRGVCLAPLGGEEARGVDHKEQAPAFLELRGSCAAGEQAVVADLHEAFGQDVLHEAAQELDRIERHRLLLAVLRVVLVAEGDASLVEL